MHWVKIIHLLCVMGWMTSIFAVPRALIYWKREWARLGEFGGHATLVRGAGAAVFHPEPAPVAALSAGIRARFDPKGILNRGLMA